jgi:hypothetical protein
LFNTGLFACFFNDYTDVGNPVVIYGNLSSWFPDLPPEIAQISGALFGLFGVAFLIRQAVCLLQGKPLNLPKLLLLTAVLGTHYVIFFATATPFLVAEALETAYHTVQYHAWMHHYQRRRFPAKPQLPWRWLGLGLLYGLIVGTIEVFGLLEHTWGLWLFMPFTMIVIYHYIIDGLIWKFSRQPELRPLWQATDLSGSAIPDP